MLCKRGRDYLMEPIGQVRELRLQRPAVVVPAFPAASGDDIYRQRRYGCSGRDERSDQRRGLRAHLP
jgi:hypothetical protein